MFINCLTRPLLDIIARGYVRNLLFLFVSFVSLLPENKEFSTDGSCIHY